MTVTVDVLMAELERSGAWLPYRTMLMERREAKLRQLLHCRPDTPSNEIHRLMGEIAGIDYALGVPDTIKQTARKET